MNISDNCVIIISDIVALKSKSKRAVYKVDLNNKATVLLAGLQFYRKYILAGFASNSLLQLIRDSISVYKYCDFTGSVV